MLTNPNSSKCPPWLKGTFAHRGLHDKDNLIIENSSSAFRRAVDHGFGIECDLQPTKDEQWVVFHDKSLERLTDQKGFVRDHTLLELTSIKLKGGQGNRIGTVEDLLTIAKGTAPLLIELKTHGRDCSNLLEPLINQLQSYKGPYALMSFNANLMANLKQAAPNSVCGLVSEQTTNLKNILPKLEPDFVAHDIADIENKFLGYYHRKTNIPVLNWTIRNLSQLVHAQGDGHGLIFEGQDVKDYLLK